MQLLHNGKNRALTNVIFMTVGSIPGMGSIPKSSRVPVLSYDRGNDGRRRGGVLPGPI